MMTKFSVVIAVYNKEMYVEKTIQSVLNQSFLDFEVIIYNDGSTDASEEKILKFTDNRIQYFKGENLGAAAARNLGIEKAQGAFIALLDADDIWHPTYLEAQHISIQQFPKYHVFATRTTSLMDGKLKERVYAIPMNKDERYVLNYFSSSTMDSVLHSSSTVLRKSLFERVGYYNPEIKSGQDTDLYVRIGIEGDIVFYNKSLVTYKVIKNSLFRSSKSIPDKPNFSQYREEELNNPALKIFLDLNRYSLCLLAKLDDDRKSFDHFKNQINLENLNWKQKILLNQNKYTLKFLKRFQNSMNRYFFKTSSFS